MVDDEVLGCAFGTLSTELERVCGIGVLGGLVLVGALGTVLVERTAFVAVGVLLGMGVVGSMNGTGFGKVGTVWLVGFARIAAGD